MRYLLPIIFITIFSLFSLGSALQESLTFDEIVHMEEGVNHLTRHEFLVDTNNPPLVRELAMAPTVFGLPIQPRLVILFLGIGLLIAVFFVTKQYFGINQANLALFLLVFEPTLLANSHYVTLDIGLTFFFFLAYITFQTLRVQFSTSNIIAAGVMFGFAAASKLLALPFFIISVLLVWPKKLSFTVFIIFFITACFVIWISYLFTFDVIIQSRDDTNRVSTRIHEYARSNGFTVIDRTLIYLETTKIPLGQYFAVIKNSVIRNIKPQKKFFMGEFYDNSRWYFLPVNLFLKLPIPLWILFIAGLFAAHRIFVVPFFVILAVVSFSNIQPLVRYILPALPFMVIVASSSISIVKSRTQKILFAILLIWYVIGTYQSFPHFISYANEFAGSQNTRFTKFMDSNLDWGQSLPDLKQFVTQTNLSRINLSYFGRDNADAYGFQSDLSYGDWRQEKICAFHTIDYPESGPHVVIISISNWYYCGYNTSEIYSKENIKFIISDSFLVFYE